MMSPLSSRAWRGLRSRRCGGEERNCASYRGCRACSSLSSAAPVRAGEIDWALPGAMKRDTHLETPDTEQQRAGHTGGHKGPIAFLHRVQQSQLKDAPAMAYRNKSTKCPTTAILARMPRAAVKTLLRPKQDSRILKRSGALVDPRSTHPCWSRSSDYQIMHPATLRPDHPSSATILPNFH